MGGFLKVYSFIGRVAYVLLQPLVSLIIRNSERTRVLIVRNGELLLVRDWLGNGQWSSPGGGFKKGESAAECAIREVHEELSLVMLEERLSFVDRRQIKPIKGSPYYASIFIYNWGNNTFKIDKREIIEAQWFSIDALPKKRSKLIDDMIEEGVLRAALTRG